MSIKSKVLAAAATLTLVGGVGAAGALSASTATAATPSCGHSCVEVFNHDFGTHAHPNFVQDTLRQGEKLGQPQILFRVSNSDPAEDYTVSYQGEVSDFYTAGLVSAEVDLHYGGLCEQETVTTPSPTPTPTVTVTVTPPPPSPLPTITTSARIIPTPAPETEVCTEYYPDDYAYEYQYSPYGVDSGLCAGVASTATAGEKVTLQPCGVSSKTIWIVDSADTAGHGYVPFINGSDTNFSQPFVLTYPSSSYPTDMPRPELYVTNLTGEQGANGLPVTGTIDSSQLFGVDVGVLAP